MQKKRYREVTHASYHSTIKEADSRGNTPEQQQEFEVGRKVHNRYQLVLVGVVRALPEGNQAERDETKLAIHSVGKREMQTSQRKPVKRLRLM